MDDNKSGFRDWIPAGEENGAITDQGFQDFVPAPEPQHHPEQTIPTEAEVKTPEPRQEEKPLVPPLEGGEE